MEQSRN